MDNSTPETKDNSLIGYIPAHPEAFQVLLSRPFAEGPLMVTLVRQWLDKEITAMAQLPAPEKPHRKFQFTKSLNETKNGDHHV